MLAVSLGGCMVMAQLYVCGWVCVSWMGNFSGLLGGSSVFWHGLGVACLVSEGGGDRGGPVRGLIPVREGLLCVSRRFH